jgi:hypothetical protein
MATCLEIAQKNPSDSICYDFRLSFALQNPADQICYDSRKPFSKGQSFIAAVVLHICRTEIFIITDNENLFQQAFDLVEEGFQLSQGLFSKLVERGVLKATVLFSIPELMKKLEWAKAHVIEEFALITEEQAVA